LAFHFTRDCNHSVGIAENLKLVGGDLIGSGVQLVPCVLANFGQGTLDSLMEDESLRGSLWGRIADAGKSKGECTRLLPPASTTESIIPCKCAFCFRDSSKSIILWFVIRTQQCTAHFIKQVLESNILKLKKSSGLVDPTLSPPHLSDASSGSGV
jgi:hypothetical protein